MNHRIVLQCICFFMTSFLCESSMTAATFLLQGTFSDDDQVQAFFLGVSDPSTVSIMSLGYAGGNTSDGTLIMSGGFDSYLTLIDLQTGMLLTENDDYQGGLPDSVTGQAFDAGIIQDLAAGSYMAILTQYGNTLNTSQLFTGFSQTGNPTFTSDPNFAPGGPCPGDRFKDSSGTVGQCRSGKYTLEFAGITNLGMTFLQIGSPPTMTTPEPKTFWLLVPVVWIVFWSRRHKSGVARLSNQDNCSAE